MFPEKEFMKRFEAILSELDALAEQAGDDTLDDLNAELEDALMLLGELRAEDGEDLVGALEDIRALAEDYRALAKRDADLADCAERLAMAAELALGGMRSQE